MFILAFVLSIILGLILGGKIKNLNNLKIFGVYLVFISFGIEFITVMCMKSGILTVGLFTYILDLIMYGILFVFIYKNRTNKYILLMGIGFILNAIPIFLNGGAMPVSRDAIKIAGLSSNISKEGLYKIINEDTKMWFLGDIIPFTFITNLVFSIGDIISAIGLVLLIITGMKKSEDKNI